MWTLEELASESRSWTGSAWRVVESQSQVSTMKLVDTLEEQVLLEEILDRTKPAFPHTCEGMHFLIATPFRYWPYPTGSRFRKADQTDGCFYAADLPETAIAELAFYRLMFFMESPGTKKPENPLEHTAFSVQLNAEKMIDLSSSPFNQRESDWMNPIEYGPCQDFADAARESGIELIRYRSVRDPQKGMNMAVLSPRAISSRQPEQTQTWRLFLSDSAIQAFREMPQTRLEFSLEDWKNDDRIKAFIEGSA